MQFEFTTVSKIIFGAGRISSIGSIVQEYGRKALVVSGAPQTISEQLLTLLESSAIKYTFIRIKHEPTIDIIHTVVNFARKSQPDLVIGIGGGSAIDTAKATTAMLSNPGNVLDYLEVIGLGKPLINPSLPLITIPTTSGTGSEVTRNAVIGSPTHHVKVSLRSPYLLPRVALVDPELTTSIPPAITAITGLDALTQLIEPFTSNSSNPLTDALCVEGIQRVGNSFYLAYDNGSNLPAREDMSLASLFSGLALSNAKLGAVHGLAGPIGGEIPAPHGAICARLLPLVMEQNVTALRKSNQDHSVLDRYANIGKILSGDTAATAETGIQWVLNFCLHAKIQPLSFYGLTEAYFSKIIDKAIIASSMKGNPITLTEVELRNILQNSL